MGVKRNILHHLNIAYLLNRIYSCILLCRISNIKHWFKRKSLKLALNANADEHLCLKITFRSYCVISALPNRSFSCSSPHNPIMWAFFRTPFMFRIRQLLCRHIFEYPDLCKVKECRKCGKMRNIKTKWQLY